MSDLKTYNVEIDVSDTAHLDKISKPPKKWRNWYKATVKIDLVRRGQRVQPGEVFCGTDVYASKDLAETGDLAHQSRMMAQYGRSLVEYFGARPEE